MERPAHRFLALALTLNILGVVILNLDAMPAGTKQVFEAWIMICGVLVIIGLAWTLRERKTNPPWRSMATYLANPIATEERYRLNQISGIIIGATLGVISMP